MGKRSFFSWLILIHYAAKCMDLHLTSWIVTQSICECFIEVLKASSWAGRTVFLWKTKRSKSVAQNNTSCILSTVNKTEYVCHFSRGFLDCPWDLDVFVFFFSFTSSLASKLQTKENWSTDFARAKNDKKNIAK